MLPSKGRYERNKYTDILSSIEGGQERVDQSKHFFCCPDHEETQVGMSHEDRAITVFSGFLV